MRRLLLLPLLIGSILLISVAPVAEAKGVKKVEYRFGPFTHEYYDNFTVVGPGTISNDALQVTPDSSGNFTLTNRSGRIFFHESFKLWHQGNGAKSVASFNTSFLINVYRVSDGVPGEGITFLIAPDKTLPHGSDGKYLGLTNSSTDGNSSNQIVAVELDTFEEDFDPDDNHVGLNINSVRSKKVQSLSPFGIQISPKGTKFYMVWIQYDGQNKSIAVYMAEQENKTSPAPSRPSTPVLRADLDISEFVNKNSYMGFSASTGSNVQLNCVLRWNITIEKLPDDGNNKLVIGLAVGIPILVLLILGLVGLGYYYWRKRRRASDPTILGALKSLPGTPREFRFRDLKKATNNFDEKRKLGQGGFGVVYRGVLQKENLEIAVKKFSRDNMQGKDDFLAELTIINRLRHKHLVRLLGWCHKNGMLLLVYDYMPNGSLDSHIFCSPEMTTLGWSLRYKILSGVASALHYLHNEYDQRVVHRDLKASNIMLDSNFHARLGDFGLARALENEKTSYAQMEGVQGTVGYIAPECFHTGRATCESDVFGFGAVLLEVVCGQRPWTKIGDFHLLVDWVWSLHREGRILEAVDKGLGNDYVVEEAERLLQLGLACSHPIASERPKTATVFHIINGSMAVPLVPPFKPPFVWSSMPNTGSVSITSSTINSTDTTPISGWTPKYFSRDSVTGEGGYSDAEPL
ncbi:hypothetical protein SLEP1_g31791 [Rubroshorea leprosula]|uniref:non-specific serine/threonine protein kinase n=1 Tax=Rubroshorea leprosula TaxID=152421 RepID=A0AAV5K6F7_9ROSI|nr:hypothetical protein SLEP1_g31791 [Rubroshorea leprosula]